MGAMSLGLSNSWPLKKPLVVGLLLLTGLILSGCIPTGFDPLMTKRCLWFGSDPNGPNSYRYTPDCADGGAGGHWRYADDMGRHYWKQGGVDEPIQFYDSLTGAYFNNLGTKFRTHWYRNYPVGKSPWTVFMSLDPGVKPTAKANAGHLARILRRRGRLRG
jgi:hypothetical protein